MSRISAGTGAIDVRAKPLTTFITTADKPESERFTFWRDTVRGSFLGLDCQRTSDQPFSGEISTTRVKEVCFSRVRACGYKYRRTPFWVRQDRERGVFIPLVLKGTFSIMQDGREARLGPGDLTFFDNARPHTGSSIRPCTKSVSDDFEQIFIHMPHEVWIRRFGSTQQVTARAVRGNTEMGAMVSTLLRQVVPYIGKADPATADRLAELSLAMVTTALGDLVSQQDACQSSGRISLLYRAKAFIEQNLHDPVLNPEKVAQGLRISERYLRDLFHEEDSTVSNWIWRRRLEKTHQDLSDPLLMSKSVSEIAFNCGFSDLTHFGRRFKAAFSATPSEFRREQLANTKTLIT